jgi:ABC-type branched-subunit amino acid transport system substrate-binding protein
MTTHGRTRRSQLIGGLAILALLAAACGGGDGDDTSAGGDTAGGNQTTQPGGDPDPGPGFDGTTINVGILVPLSGLPAIIGEPLAAGQETYWAHVNEDLGGVAGKYPVKPVIEDSQYETNVTVQKYNKIKNDVVIFSQVMGTPHNQALLPLLEDDNLVVAPASQDAMWVREQNLLPIIQPYQIDVVNGMAYWMEEAGGEGSTVCAIIQNDVYGEAGLEGLEFAAERMDFDVTTVARFKGGDAEFTAQVTSLRNNGCELVWATALPSEFGGILRKAAEMNFTPQWIAQSPAWVDVLAGGDLREYIEANVWIAALGTEPDDTSDPGMAKLVEHRERFRPEQKPDYYFNFGYYQAMAVHQVLERAVERGDLGRDGIIEAMNSLEKLEFGGLIGDYQWGTPEERQPSPISTVFKINMDKPFGLEAVKVNFSTDHAEAYELDGGR